MSKIIKLFSFLFFLFSFLILLRVFFLNNYPDFNVTYYSSKFALSGINPYIGGKGLFVSQVYPPIFMLLLSPVWILPFFVSAVIWTLFSIFSIFVSVYLIFKTNSKNIFSSLGFFVLGLIFLSFPLKFTLGMGQVNNFIFLIVVLAILFLNKNRRLVSGLILSLSLAIKFFPIFFPLYFLVMKKWKILTSVILGFIFLYLIAFIFIDPKINLYFYKDVFLTLLGGYKTDYYNQSLAGFIGRSFNQQLTREVTKYLLSIFFVAISFFAIWKTRKIKYIQNMHLGLLITLNLLVNNFSWQHHFVFMIFPFLATLFFIIDKKLKYRYLLILFISYVLISINLKNPNDFPIILQSHVFYGAVLLWVLQVFLILKNSPRLQLNFSSAWKH